MKDYIVRATASDNQIRAFVATTRELTEHARITHDTSPVSTVALGRILTAGVMMGSMMKGREDLLTLRIKSDGPIGGLLVTANSCGKVKGYVNNKEVMIPPNEKGKFDVGGAIGKGVLSVIKDLGLKEPYTGDVELISGEIAEDITYYFLASEQIPTATGLGVLMNKDNTVKQAGGFIIQLMPFTEDEVIDRLEKKIKDIHSVTEFLDKGMTPENILEELLGEFGVKILDTLPASFACDCSKKRVEKAILSIKREDLQEMIEDGEPIEVNCHFCSTSYLFTADELKGIICN